jgi:tellurite resistance protein
MGLFTNLDFSSVSTNTSIASPAEAVIAVVLAAVGSDGYVSNEECERAWISISHMQLFRSYSADVVNRMFSKWGGILGRHGFNYVMLIARQSLPLDLRATVFAIAADLVLADGELDPQEEEFLNTLYQLLEVPPEIAQQIVMVMAIKNRG